MPGQLSPDVVDDIFNTLFDDIKMAQLTADQKEIIVQLSDDMLSEAKNNITYNDMTYAMCKRTIDTKPAAHHLDNTNTFYLSGINQIMTDGFIGARTITKLKDPEIQKIMIAVTFSNVQFDKPTYNSASGPQPLFPIDAINRNMTYSAAVYTDIKVVATAYYHDNRPPVERTKSVNRRKICSIPIVVGSVYCHTYQMTGKQLFDTGHDPSDNGGYFIINGNEWMIVCSESITFNKMRPFMNRGYESEVGRNEIICKPGDGYENSGQLIVRISTTHQLTVEITHAPLRKLNIPFMLIFRALGCVREETMVDYIMADSPPNIRNDIKMRIKQYFEAKYVDFDTEKQFYQQDALLSIAAAIKNRKDKGETFFKNLEFGTPEHCNQAIVRVLKHIGSYLAPNLGNDDSAHASKAKFLGLLFNRAIRAEMGNIPSTDRDSYSLKRIHASGTSVAKAFKTFVSLSIIRPMMEAYTKNFASISFTDVILESPFSMDTHSNTFENLMASTITSGVKKNLQVGNRTVKNHITSQAYDRRNATRSFTLGRLIITPGNENSRVSERALAMRGVHPTGTGFICEIFSPEGATVGLTKQLAFTATISNNGNSDLLRTIVTSDPEILPFATTEVKQVMADELNYVMVNGSPVGYHRDTLSLVKKYRTLRRKGKLNWDVTISYDERTGDAEFWVDVGRLLRPLFIVYNNKENPELFKVPYNKEDYKTFRQGIRYTPEHVKRIMNNTMSFDNLIEQQIIEYVSPEEQENCLLACTLQILRENYNNECKQYTHCEVPIAKVCLPVATSPFANHNQTPRITFHANQGVSACGYYILNPHTRAVKEAFLQNKCSQPLVRTISSVVLPPNGHTVPIANMSYLGYNQNDSLTVNDAMVQRGGYNGSKYGTIYVQIDNVGDVFGQPDITKTTELQKGNYGKINADGYMPQNSILELNDVAVAMYGVLSEPTKDGKTFQNKSVRWTEHNSAIVDSVIRGVSVDGKKFIKLVYRKIRPIQVGDKFSSRSGQKGVVGSKLPQYSLPFNEYGIAPSFIMNPCAYPSRMTIGQLIEILGMICVRKGIFADGTMFNEQNIQAIIKELNDSGETGIGYHDMYCGITGERIDTQIYMTPIFEQRLPKFAQDNEHVAAVARVDQTTRQAIGSKSKGGALRLGEMEVWVMLAQGIGNVLNEKLFKHADGFPIYICEKCGNFGIVNTKKNIYMCTTCKTGSHIYLVHSSWSSKMVFQKLQAMNIGTKMVLMPPVTQRYE